MFSQISEQTQSFLPIFSSEQTRSQNFSILIQNLEVMPCEVVQKLYTKNVALLKKNIKLLPTCPSLNEISNIFNEVYSMEKKNKAICSPQYFFSKGKTLFIWLLSTYEYLAKISPENLKNHDWSCISLFLPGSDPNALKCKWFRYIKQAYTHAKWTIAQDEALLRIMKESYPVMFEIDAQHKNANKVKWAKVSYELNKNTMFSHDFKKDSQCRERWFNHLNPYLNKKGWTLEEDIKLLEKALNNPKKWAKISVYFYGRNQHSVKNRFIFLINREFSLKWQKTKEVMKRDDLKSLIKKTLDSLYIKRTVWSNEVLEHSVKNISTTDAASKQSSKENSICEDYFESSILFGKKECDNIILNKEKVDEIEEDPIFFLDFKHLY